MTPLLSSAAWISSSRVGGPRTTSPCPYFRKSFSLDRPVHSARLQVTALGCFECEINGRRVGDEVFSPGWTDFRKTLYVETHDVANLLVPGDNGLGAILGDGWFCGFVAWKNRQSYGDRPYLRLALEVEYTDGTLLTVATDGSWLTSSGPILESDMLMGEAYDARQELGEWSSSGYDNSSWSPVRIDSPGFFPELLPRTGPPVRRIEEITPPALQVIPYWTGPIRIYDLGQNFAGRIRLRVRAARGRTLRIRHAEMVKPDGRIYTTNLREARADDSYVCRGSEEEIWEPRFTFHGFRYVEVTGQVESDFVEITGVVLHSDMKPTGSFACSNPLLNQLQSAIRWSQKSNFLEVPTDCPQRDERMGWTGDAQIFVRAACFNFDVSAFFHKWMRDMRDAQQPSGGIPCVVPHLDIVDVFDEEGGPAWSDALIICPWTIYLCYGDRTILEDNYDAMTRYLDFVLQKRCVGLIRSHPDIKAWPGYGDWLALDESGNDLGSTPFDLIGTAFLAHDADLLARISDILGRTAEAESYRDLRQRVAAAFRERFLTAEGTLTAATQTAAVLTLHFDLVDGSLRQRVMHDLLTQIAKNNWHLGTGFVGTTYLLDVLEKEGHLDLAYRLLEQETFPSWLFPITNGATTIWERWDAWTPDKGFHGDGMNSFNHYAFGCVGAWMVRTAAGLELDPADPGYRHIIFRPRPGGSLTWAEASLETPQGPAGIRWDLIEGRLIIRLTIPKGARGTLSLPDGFDCEDGKSAFRPGSHEVEATQVVFS